MNEGAVAALARSNARLVATAAVPSTPGLYAVHAGAESWEELGLGAPPDDRPLYVGKSESNLAGRDVNTHFCTGKTGSSTLRRSIGALLAEKLELRAVPRNLARPGHFANYSFDANGDERLTGWMLEHLRLAVWPRDDGVDLLEAERAALGIWQPPLNGRDVVTPWLAQVRAARKRMASEARSYS
jgi:hypothetical protein